MEIRFTLPGAVNSAQLNIFVRALCAYDVMWLRANPQTPNIYESGVRYETQPGGGEHFKPIPLIIEAGTADCDQLAPWRAAELRVRHGIKAMPEVRKMGAGLWHVFVRLPDGKVEDVSARLGMPIPRRLVEAGNKLLGRTGASGRPRRIGGALGRQAWERERARGLVVRR